MTCFDESQHLALDLTVPVDVEGYYRTLVKRAQ